MQWKWASHNSAIKLLHSRWKILKDILPNYFIQYDFLGECCGILDIT